MKREPKYKFLIKALCILFLSGSSFISYADGFQKNHVIDSLYKVLENEKQDTSRINLLNAIAVEKSKTNLDSALVICKQVIELSEKINNKEKAARAYYFAGSLCFLKGDYPGGLKQQLKALQFVEGTGPQTFHAQILNSVGNVFFMQNDFEKAEQYYLKAFDLAKKLNNYDDMARGYANIGLIYAYQKNIPKSMKYFNESLLYREKAPNLVEKAITYDFIGFAYINAGDNLKALEYLDTSLVINRQLKNTVRIIDNLRNRGECYLNLKNYKLAEKDLLESLSLSQQYGHTHGLEGNYVLLSTLYEKSNDFTKALKFYERYIVLRDSVYNSENTKNSLQQEIKFEYDKKVAADSVRVVEEKKVSAAQLKHEQTQRYSLYGGLTLLGLFALFMVNRFRVISKQKEIIASQTKIVEQQKAVVEAKQKEVLDSIRYAKRIQRSHLPSEKYLMNNLSRLQKF